MKIMPCYLSFIHSFFLYLPSVWATEFLPYTCRHGFSNHGCLGCEPDAYHPVLENIPQLGS